jgi:hypothetical protein
MLGALLELRQALLAAARRQRRQRQQREEQRGDGAGRTHADPATRRGRPSIQSAAGSAS